MTATETKAAHTATPTTQQIALAKFADDCEEMGIRTSAYYRLWPQIVSARAAISKATGAA